jgi:hypothetical protein
LTTEEPLSQLIEELAAIEHERWAHWQRHMHEHMNKANVSQMAAFSYLLN